MRFPCRLEGEATVGDDEGMALFDHQLAEPRLLVAADSVHGAVPAVGPVLRLRFRVEPERGAAAGDFVRVAAVAVAQGDDAAGRLRLQARAALANDGGTDAD